MRNFSPREKSIAVCDGQAPEDGDLPQKCAERFLKKPSELEIQAEEWKTVPWVWEKFCNISDLFTLFGLKFWKVISFTRECSKRNLNLGPEFSVGAASKVIVPFRFFLPSTYKVRMRIVMTAGGTMGTKWRRTKTKLNWSIIDLGSRSTATTAAVQKKFAVSSLVLHGQQWLRVRQEVARKQFPSPDRAPTCWRRVVTGRFHFGGASRPQLRWSTTASWVGDSVIAARSTLSKTTRALNMLKGTDGQHAGAIAFLKRVFGSRSTAGRVATPQDLSVTKQHRDDRWDRCTASAGDWQIITTTSHRSANQRYFMHIKFSNRTSHAHAVFGVG